MWKTSSNRPFAASHSRGKKPPCWRAKVALGQDKQRKLPSKITYVFRWSCPSATFVLQHGGFVPREWQLQIVYHREIHRDGYGLTFKFYPILGIPGAASQ